MPVVKYRTDLHPLCYEHHAKMKLVQIPSKNDISGKGTLAYTCPVPDCLIRYSGRAGYFVADLTPRISCPHHRMPMYLAEVQPRKRSFRLWRCPQSGCRASLTNEEHLVA